MKEKGKNIASYEVQKMVDEFFYENEKEEKEIMKMLEKVKKKHGKIPPHKTVRLVDLPFEEAFEFAEEMNRMRERYETDDGRRPSRRY
jgi:hypothetical protein